MRRRYKFSLIAIFGFVLLGAVTVLVLINFAEAEAKIEHHFQYVIRDTESQFLREVNVLLGSSITAGNRIVDLQNGDEIFPAMLAAIEKAEHTINLETFIFWSGDVGAAFTRALSDQARAGRIVNVIIDAVGSTNLDRQMIDEMRDAGVTVERYHPVSILDISRLNNRTHRKLLIVDGRVGFTGGVGYFPTRG